MAASREICCIEHQPIADRNRCHLLFCDITQSLSQCTLHGATAPRQRARTLYLHDQPLDSVVSQDDVRMLHLVIEVRERPIQLQY